MSAALICASGCAPSRGLLCNRGEGIAHLEQSLAPREDSSGEVSQLLAYRSYFSLVEVGPYAHHFSVSLRCLDWVLGSVAITPAGLIHSDGPWWAGGGPAFMASRTPAPPIPEPMRPYARRIQRAVAAAYGTDSDVRVAYEGSFRTVRVRESVPLDVPGAESRLEVYREHTLSANADLTAIESTRHDKTGGVTGLCWKHDEWHPCVREQRWIPFVPDRPRASPQLDALLGLNADPIERRRFETVLLTTARAVAAGGSGARFAEVQAMQSPSLLPAGLTIPIAVSFELHALLTKPAGTESSRQERQVRQGFYDFVQSRP